MSMLQIVEFMSGFLYLQPIVRWSSPWDVIDHQYLVNMTWSHDFMRWRRLPECSFEPSISTQWGCWMLRARCVLLWGKKGSVSFVEEPLKWDRPCLLVVMKCRHWISIFRQMLRSCHTGWMVEMENIPHVYDLCESSHHLTGQDGWSCVTNAVEWQYNTISITYRFN